MEFPDGYGKLLDIPHIYAISEAIKYGFDIWVCKDQKYCEKADKDRFGVRMYRFNTGSEMVGKKPHEFEVAGTRVSYSVLTDDNPKTVPGFYIHFTQLNDLKAWLNTTEFKNNSHKIGINSNSPFYNRGAVVTTNPLFEKVKKGGRHTRHSKPVRKHKRRTHRQRSRR